MTPPTDLQLVCEAAGMQPLGQRSRALTFQATLRARGAPCCCWKRCPQQQTEVILGLSAVLRLKKGVQVVSSLLAGAAVGSLGGSGLADSFGRRTTLLLDALPMAAGAVLSATASGLQVQPNRSCTRVCVDFGFRV